MSSTVSHVCNPCVISARGSGFCPSKLEPKSSFSESSIHWESKKKPRNHYSCEVFILAQKEGFEPTQKIYISIAALFSTVFRVQIRVQF